MRVEHWSEQTDGPLSETAMREKLAAEGYAVYSHTYSPGTYFEPHTHGMDKVTGVLSGRFRMCMCGREVILGPGDMLFVPADEVHEAEVVGDEAVVSLDAVRYV